MRKEERRRIILASAVAGGLHVLLLFVTFVFYQPQEPEEDYRGPVMITFARDRLQDEPVEVSSESSDPVDVPNNQENVDSVPDVDPPEIQEPVDNTSNNNQVTENSNPQTQPQSAVTTNNQNTANTANADNPTSGEVDSSVTTSGNPSDQNNPNTAQGNPDTPAPDPTSNPVENTQSSPTGDPDFSGRQYVQTTNTDNTTGQSDTDPVDDPGDSGPELDIGNLDNLFQNTTNDNQDTNNDSGTPTAPSQDNDFGLEGDIRNLQILASVEPIFHTEVTEGLLAVRLQVNPDGSVVFLNIDYPRSSAQFRTLFSEPQLTGPIREALKSFRLTSPGAQAKTGWLTFRFEN